MRKILAGVLCSAMATVPAVAFAATDDDIETDNVNNQRGTETAQVRKRVEQKLDKAVDRAKDKRKQELRRKRERKLTAAPAQGGAAPAHLEAIAACESGGDPGAIGGGGAYRGKYQFDYSTWASVGGSGDPAAASEAEQDMRAQMLYERAGSAPWPVCG
jgi:soluble lytic murein transglycosylase-like protein